MIDFLFEDGLFFISVRNIGRKPAYKVSTRFDRPLYGIGGAREISALPLFKCIETLPPGREIKAFLDTSASYFSRNGPTLISAEVCYQDAHGGTLSSTIRHNLEIYKDIGYIHSERY